MNTYVLCYTGYISKVNPAAGASASINYALLLPERRSCSHLRRAKVGRRTVCARFKDRSRDDTQAFSCASVAEVRTNHYISLAVSRLAHAVRIGAAIRNIYITTRDNERIPQVPMPLLFHSCRVNTIRKPL